MNYIRRRIAATVAATATIAVALTACAGAADSANTTSGTTLVLGSLLPVTTFDTAEANWSDESPYLQAVYDTVLRASPDGEIEAGLAESWSYDEAGTTLDLELRDGVTFSDGEAVDAETVAENLLRNRDGGGAAVAGLSNIEDVVAVDADTVQVTLATKDAAFLTFLTMSGGLVSSPTSFDSAESQTTPVGSGPYVLDQNETVVGTSYVFTRREDYWDAETFPYERIDIKVLSDQTALVNAIKAGQVNFTNLINNDSVEAIEAAGYSIDTNELDMAGLQLFDRSGTIVPALEDVRVRQAINYAFDREALLTAISNGFGTVTEQVYPTTSPAYDESLNTTYDYDPEKARDLLAEAGYADGFDLPMPTWTTLFGSSLYAVVQEQLAAVGIKALYTEVGSNFVSDLLAGEYPAAFIKLNISTAAGGTVIRDYLAPDATWNMFHSQNADFDALLTAVAAATTDAGYADALSAVNRYVTENAWFATWFRPSASYASDSSTDVVIQKDNTYPYLWNIVPKS